MSKQDTGGPAFPIPGYNQPEGMTLRDYFAAKALHGLLANRYEWQTPDEFARLCFEMADAMLEARK